MTELVFMDMKAVNDSVVCRFKCCYQFSDVWCLIFFLVFKCYCILQFLLQLLFLTFEAFDNVQYALIFYGLQIEVFTLNPLKALHLHI